MLPEYTRTIRFGLFGDRLSGTDNNAYFRSPSLTLSADSALQAQFGSLNATSAYDVSAPGMSILIVLMTIAGIFGMRKK